jgi:hypothetical protein
MILIILIHPAGKKIISASNYWGINKKFQIGKCFS